MALTIYSAAQIGLISQNLGAVQDWLAENCEARHADDMAEVVGKAIDVLEDLYDDMSEREA